MPIPIKKTTTVTIGPTTIAVEQGDKIELKLNSTPLIGGESGITIPENGNITITISAILGDI